MHCTVYFLVRIFISYRIVQFSFFLCSRSLQGWTFPARFWFLISAKLFLSLYSHIEADDFHNLYVVQYMYDSSSFVSLR